MKIERRHNYGQRKNNLKNKNTIDINFDIMALNLMSSYVLSSNRHIKRSHLVNMRNLFDILNMDVYINDSEKLKRIEFIKKGLEGKLDYNIKNTDLLYEFINGGMGESDLIDFKNFPQLTTEELNWINDTISESLKYAYIYNDMYRFMDICTRFQAEDYKNRGIIVNEFEDLVKNIQTKFRHAKPQNDIDMTFSLRDDFEGTMKDIHERITNPSKRLYSGMQGFNELLGGAFESTRVYMLLGITGGGKSLTLLDLAYQMKKYNTHYRPKDPTKTPVILYITQENSVDESVERLFNIATDKEPLENYTAEEAIRMLKNEGEMFLSDESPIDLMIKFIPDKSIDTNDLYSIIEDLEDDGYEVISVIQDHIKKMRSARKQTDLRIELGDIINEFKVLATLKDLVFITNSHLNRDAASKIDEAVKSNKSDLIRLLGRANIGESLLMLDNVDGAFMIAQEYDSNGNKFLGIQRIKKRYKASDRNIIFQPYTNPFSIRLIEDIKFNVPVFRDTLKDMPNGMTNFNQGTQIPKTSVYQNDIPKLEDVLNKSNASNALSEIEDINIFKASKYSSIDLSKDGEIKDLINPFIKIGNNL